VSRAGRRIAHGYASPAVSIETASAGSAGSVLNIDMARPSLGSLAAICFLVLTAVVITARPAAGCSCVTGAPVCEAFWQATAVFTGRVTDIEPVTARDGPPRTHRLVHFEVIDGFRGVTSESTVALVTGQGGGDCGYEFRPGNAYIVYAVTNPQSGQLTTSICSRTRLLGEASDDITYARAIRTNPTAGGTISGTVRDGDRMNEDRHEYAPKSGVPVVLTRDGVEYRAVTDQSGAFQIGGLAAGTYAVRIETGPNDYAEPFPREVVLRDERGCAAVDAIVRHDGRIRGRVVDASGRPVPFVGVELWSADYVTQRSRRFQAELKVRSREDGQGAT
jgi:Carboxypeptidase regulatory-like domain